MLLLWLRWWLKKGDTSHFFIENKINILVVLVVALLAVVVVAVAVVVVARKREIQKQCQQVDCNFFHNLTILFALNA